MRGRLWSNTADNLRDVECLKLWLGLDSHLNDRVDCDRASRRDGSSNRDGLWRHNHDMRSRLGCLKNSNNRSSLRFDEALYSDCNRLDSRSLGSIDGAGVQDGLRGHRHWSMLVFRCFNGV